MENYIQEY